MSSLPQNILTLLLQFTHARTHTSGYFLCPLCLWDEGAGRIRLVDDMIGVALKSVCLESGVCVCVCGGSVGNDDVGAKPLIKSTGSANGTMSN